MTPARRPILAVVVAALGYFVDIYDLILFGVVRVKSLRDLGLDEAAVLERGLFILNAQMIGMLLGGLLWGVLGDRRGRLSVLFASIVLYSVANIANGFVTSVGAYAAIRFVAGVGLAGELGAGITLVAELLPKATRGYGTTAVAALGICGGVVAGLVGDAVPWRIAYFIGGGMGLALLALRVGVMESGMFEAVKQRAHVTRGDFLSLFTSWSRARRYLAVILVGLPIWYVIAILVSTSPELGKALGLSPAPSAGRALMWSYAGLAVGDLASGFLSQALRSRKKAAAAFVLLTAICAVLYFVFGGRSLTAFYALCAALGFATGYWAVFVTIASEQFGTNVRATVTTTVPNFVRGAVVPITLAFQAFKTSLGVGGAAAAVGAITIALAFVALLGLDETFGKDLDYVEE